MVECDRLPNAGSLGNKILKRFSNKMGDLITRFNSGRSMYDEWKYDNSRSAANILSSQLNMNEHKPTKTKAINESFRFACQILYSQTSIYTYIYTCMSVGVGAGLDYFRNVGPTPYR